ncbi:dynein-related subfamily AAA family protein [Streptomyces sp. TLI_55]|uniref:ATP-binding protein n=1 Tax=Streptomyces sp. TLI_55 TaxID=1938861 RepID=UPI000BD21623|nr:AAA family ATPase [Streptomyces sp. TLI_55]SNX65901.1 dynein-related subfamily AAA family protein [Streptomyces sp. TLI_55]
MTLTDTATALPPRQTLPAEERFATELAFLAAHDDGPRPPGWLLTPRAVITFVCGSGGEALKLPGAHAGLPDELVVAPKFVGERALVERCVVTLAGERGLLLVGEPGTAKSMLSELLSAAVSGTSALTVQGTAGTTEDALRYGWNYALLLAQGPTPQALVDSPVLAAMRAGQVARVEEITRCLPEVQDALVSILSDRRMSVPELSGTADAQVAAAPGFTVIATANLRDRGVSEMSAALKRRFNFETVHPIADVEAETALVKRQATAAVERAGAAFGVDDAVLDVLVTVFRDLRAGRSAEGWDVERPGTVMSTAEAVQVAASLGVAAAYLPGGDSLDLVPGHLLGVVRKDDPADHARLLGYWDGPVRRRAEDGSATWRRLWDLRENLR